MDTDDLRKVMKFAIIFNAIVALLCIFIRYESSGAFRLLHNLGLIIIIPFIGIFFTFFVYVITWLVHKYWRKDYTTTLSYIFALAVGVGYFIFAMSIFNPKSYTKEEFRTKQLKELNKMTKKGDKMLAKSENMITDRTIVFEDSTAIINYFNHFLDSTFYNYSDSLIIEYSSIFHNLFTRNLIRRPYGGVEMIFDSIETDRYRQIIKNNLSIDLFSYSPDKSKLLIVMTYEIGEEPIEANALILIGERNNNQIILYKYGCFRNDYGVVNKQYALYETIMKFEDRSIPCNQNKESPFKKSFWNTGWFEKVIFNGAEKYRYQLDNYAYGYDEKNQWRRITAEIETFIVIEK
jgi:hypothetical protein